MSSNLSEPQIMIRGRTRDGGFVIIDDFRESYWWLRDNTPEDSRVMAWWDYGYQVSAPRLHTQSSTAASRSDIRLIQHLDSPALGLVRRWLLIGYFPIHLLPRLHTSLPTDNCPQPKETLPAVSTLTLPY
jgi:hypothetical protein